MASKDRAARKEQKLYWENKLSRRLEVLTEKGLEPGRIAKDPTVKKIRARLRKTETRLKAIDELAKKNEEMIEAKAAKAKAEAKAKTKEKAKGKVETKAKTKAKTKEKGESKAEAKEKADKVAAPQS